MTMIMQWPVQEWWPLPMSGASGVCPEAGQPLLPSEDKAGENGKGRFSGAESL